MVNKKIFISTFIFLMLLNLITACININTASLTELDKLNGIGPVKAQAIIDTRPFETLDDLIKVYGIGPSTLQKIKDQGLACVEGSQDTPKESVDEELEKIENSINEPETTIASKQLEENNEKSIITTINLNPKDINSENDTSKISKSDYALYGLVAFSIFMVLLFLLRRKKDKNEFE